MNVIYKATFPNGKSYIGKSKNFKYRKMAHYYNSKYAKVNNTKMKNAIIKYGFDNISWSILFESSDMNIINEKEKEFIEIYDTINSGYNISTGGDGGDTISNNERRLDIIRSQLKSKGINPEEYVVITDELKSEIIKDYVDKKFSIKALSRKFLISNQRLTRLLKLENIEIDKDISSKINTFNPSEELINIICEGYKSGKTIKYMSEELDLTIMIVSRILHDSGVRESKRFKNGKRYDGKQPKKRKLNDKIG